MMESAQHQYNQRPRRLTHALHDRYRGLLLLPTLCVLLLLLLPIKVSSQDGGRGFLLNQEVLDYMNTVARLQEAASDPDLPNRISDVAAELEFNRLSYYWETPFATTGTELFAQTILGRKGSVCYAVFHGLPMDPNYRFVPNPMPIPNNPNLLRYNCEPSIDTDNCQCRAHWLWMDRNFPEYWEELQSGLETCMSNCLSRNGDCDMVLGGFGEGGMVATLLSFHFADTYAPYVISMGGSNVLYDEDCVGIDQSKYFRFVNTMDNSAGGGSFGLCFDDVSFMGGSDVVDLGYTIGLGMEAGNGMVMGLGGTGQLMLFDRGATRSSQCRMAHDSASYQSKLQLAFVRNPSGFTPNGFGSSQYCEVDRDCQNGNVCAIGTGSFPECSLGVVPVPIPVTPMPTPFPTLAPVSPNPTLEPTSLPPTAFPTPWPTSAPLTPNPTAVPTALPTPLPTLSPTPNPTFSPTSPPPTPVPTFSPTSLPPTLSPTTNPPVLTLTPISRPSPVPTPFPTAAPPTTPNPTSAPTFPPTTPSPTNSPTTAAPIQPEVTPSPSTAPIVTPSPSTTIPTSSPSASPTSTPPTTGTPTSTASNGSVVATQTPSSTTATAAPSPGMVVTSPPTTASEGALDAEEVTIDATTDSPTSAMQEATIAPTQQPTEKPVTTPSPSLLVYSLESEFFRVTLVLRDVIEKLGGFSVFFWEDQTSEHLLDWILQHTIDENWDPPLMQLRVQANIVTQKLLYTTAPLVQTAPPNVIAASMAPPKEEKEKGGKSHKGRNGKSKRSDGGRRRRRGQRRRIQEERVEALQIVFDVAISYRTPDAKNGELDLAGLILEAFQSGKGKSKYGNRLKDGEDPVFAAMSDLVLQVEDNRAVSNGVAGEPDGKKSVLDDPVLFWVIVGSASFAAVTSALILVLYWRRTGKGQYMEGSSSSGKFSNNRFEKAIFVPASDEDNRVSPDGTRLSQEIVVDPEQNDGISTLGDPTFYPGAPYNHVDETTAADNTANLNYARSYLNDHKYDDNNRSDKQSGSRKSLGSPMNRSTTSGSGLSFSKVGSGLSGLNESAIFTDDEGSFEEQFAGRDKCFVVAAPPGKLGIIIDLNDSGEPLVRAIRGDSPLAKKVKVGDRLLSVDGEGCADMAAETVSKLIALKSHQSKREIMFVRRQNDYM